MFEHKGPLFAYLLCFMHSIRSRKYRGRIAHKCKMQAFDFNLPLMNVHLFLMITFYESIPTEQAFINFLIVRLDGHLFDQGY